MAKKNKKKKRQSRANGSLLKWAALAVGVYLITRPVSIKNQGPVIAPGPTQQANNQAPPKVGSWKRQWIPNKA